MSLTAISDHKHELRFRVDMAHRYGIARATQEWLCRRTLVFNRGLFTSYRCCYAASDIIAST